MMLSTGGGKWASGAAVAMALSFFVDFSLFPANRSGGLTIKLCSEFDVGVWLLEQMKCSSALGILNVSEVL
jgi:hypothetical protein